MSDYFEIDFLQVSSSKSGDAISIRYSVAGTTRIHVVDGGFQDTGDTLVSHINKYYSNPTRIDSVIVSHPDGDHAGGLRRVLEEFDVAELWMLRPWLFANELIARFETYTSVERLVAKLKDVYNNIAVLEEMAVAKNIPIRDPFQGAKIGAFTVLAPTKRTYLDLVVASNRTPDSSDAKMLSPVTAARQFLEKAASKIVALARAVWGEEVFPDDDTSPENNMSVIQFALLNTEKILLTADAGRQALAEAANYAPYVGLSLPGINRIQIPHHGSRHNVSTSVLDCWLGNRLPQQPEPGRELFTAVVSASKEDEDHPRKAVIRAFIHRGAKVISTEGGPICVFSKSPPRGWSAATALPYPNEQEA